MCSVQSSRVAWFPCSATGSSDWMFQYAKIRQPLLPTCDVWSRGCLYYATEQEQLNETQLQWVYDGQVHNKSAAMAVNTDLHSWWWSFGNRTRALHFANFTRQYTFSIYWSALTLTTLGEQVLLNNSPLGVADLFLFLIILGHYIHLYGTSYQ